MIGFVLGDRLFVEPFLLWSVLVLTRAFVDRVLFDPFLDPCHGGGGALVSIQKPLVTYGFPFEGNISALRDF